MDFEKLIKKRNDEDGFSQFIGIETTKLEEGIAEADIIAGVCLACSKVMDVYEKSLESGLEMLEDMSGHAGMKKYLEDGYEVISM